MYVISFTFKNISIEKREKLALDKETAHRFYQSLKSHHITENVYLSTCNRTELFCEKNYEIVLREFSDITGVEQDELLQTARVYEGSRAYEHLFRVCAGLESMVVGEDEILHQIKLAYENADEEGMVGAEFHAAFQKAFNTAKSIKTNTLLSKSSVSVATLVAKAAHEVKEGKKSVLLIGAGGEIGTKILKDLVSYEEFEIYSTVHRRHLPEAFGHVIDYKERYEYLDRVDVVISATSSPHFTLTKKEAWEHGSTEKNRLFIDLAVPRDLDYRLGELENITLLTIDDFEAIAKENQSMKESEITGAEAMVDEGVEELKKQLLFQDFFSELDSLKKDYDSISKFIFDYKNEASAKELKSFIDVVKRLEK